MSALDEGWKIDGTGRAFLHFDAIEPVSRLTTLMRNGDYHNRFLIYAVD